MDRVGPIFDPARLDAVRETGLLDTPPEESLDSLARLAATLLDAPYAFATLVDDERSFWKSRVGITDPAVTQNRVEESFCQYVIASGEPLIVDDVTANPVTADNPSIRSMGVASWAGYPIRTTDGLVLGTFCVVDTVVRSWSARDTEVLRVLAGAAGRELAMRAAARDAERATELVNRANARTALIAEVGTTLSQTLDLEEAVSRLARLVVPMFGDWSVVSVIQRADDGEGSMRDLGWWHADPERRPLVDKFVGNRLEGLEGRGATFEARRAVEPQVLSEGALEAGLDVMHSEQAKQVYRDLKPGSFGVFPLVGGGEVNGILAIVRDEGRPPMTPEDVELAMSLASRAGITLDNARLYERQTATATRMQELNQRIRRTARHDRTVAMALQEALLPRLPQPDHLQLVGRYLTADVQDQIGGDWYDALMPADGSTTLVIGDVAGHDITAAAVMGELRNMLRAFAWDHEHDPPAALIGRLDHAMADLAITHMTTLAVLRIEQPDTEHPDVRAVRWSNAGHPPPVLITPDGEASLLAGVPDLPLGIHSASPRVDHVSTIPASATLVLYTDGVIETRTRDIDDRLDELLALLGTHHALPLDAMLDTVLERMVGDQPDDDAAMLALRFRA